MYEYDATTDQVSKVQIPCDGFTFIYSLEMSYKFASMTDSLHPKYQYRKLSEAIGITTLYLAYMSNAHFSETPYNVTTADLCMRARAILDGLAQWRTELKDRIANV